MSFYDDASLVVIPSAQKTSKLYAVKPTDGSGDLTFTRTGDTATRVNSAGLIEPVLANVPRLDYLGSSCPRLLLEPQRTNLATFSESFDNAVWSKNALTINANSAVSPDGYNNADKLQDSTNTLDNHLISSGPLATAGITYTWSAFMKKAEYNYGHLHAYDKAGAIFDLNAGAVISTDGIGATIRNYGNGWFLCTYTFVALNTGVFINPSKTSTSAYSYTGTIGSGIYVWGAQLEAGAYATSYIPTLAASVTRGADACSKTGISSLIGQTEGTLFAEFNYKGTASADFAYIFAIGDGSSNNRIILIKNSGSSQVYLYVINGGVIQINSGAIAGTNVIGSHKIALAYKQNDYVLYLDGVSVYTGPPASVPAVSNFYLGIGDTSGAEILSGTVSQALLFKTRLTNAQLAELTTL